MSPGDSWSEQAGGVNTGGVGAASAGQGKTGGVEAASAGGGQNLIVTGFMGTGKTEIGREVARLLGREFVDMDAEIEARAGKPIARIFAEEGEMAFRLMEAALCADLSSRQGLVVATGGGALVDAANRAVMMRTGTVVCLHCDVDEILRRVAAGRGERPLLSVANPRAEIERLLAARHEAYAAIPWQVDTNGHQLQEIAGRVAGLAGVVSLPVHYPGGEYPIHLGAGLLDYAGGALRAAGAPAGSRVAVVSNPVVAPLYGARLEASLRAVGLQPFSCIIPDGEQHKTLDTLAGLYQQLLAGTGAGDALDRSDTLLSLGGGVTGDVGGLAAATYLRGVRFVQVPTSLLAMADASVGGKTAVDLPQGKNLVGAFKQPALVLIDPAVLASLPADELRSGLAEVIKHGILADPVLFKALEAGDPPAGEPTLLENPEVLARAIRVKIDVIEQDPYERGWRASLNLGHTVGHALEQLSGFGLRHGEAVSIGIVAAAHLAVELGRADPALPGRIEAVLAGWGLPVRCPPYDSGEIWAAMAHDKKRRGRSLRWVLPRAIGRAEIVHNVPPDVVRSVLQGMGAVG